MRSPFLAQRIEEVELVEIAVHIVDGGDAERRAIIESALQGRHVATPLHLRCGRHRILACRQTESLAALCRRQLEDRAIGGRLLEFARGEAVRAHDDLIAGRQFLAREEAPASLSARVLAQTVW